MTPAAPKANATTVMAPDFIEHSVAGGVPIKMWTRGVPVEDEATRQLGNAARLPIVFRHIAAMPDVHVGIGATVGSVIPTLRAIIPAAVGVDIGCGMMAAKTTLRAQDLPDSLAPLRTAIERAVPHGRAPKGRDPGAWSTKVPGSVDTAWSRLEPEFAELTRDYPKLEKTNHRVHLGTLGTGNHFIEVCLDEQGFVWFMLHSGSRGVGNAIGTMFIELAKQDAMRHNANLPDRDLAYSKKARATSATTCARSAGRAFAALNRELMMKRVIDAAKTVIRKSFQSHVEAVNCHHNYVQREHHFGEDVYVTRKGALSAKVGQLGIIPGSMGACSYIVRGKGNAESFESCSHGAGRRMSRSEAKRRFTLADHRAATEGVECRKDKDVIDETPAAYKDIDAVMAAQRDLVEVVHTLKQVVCVKG
jgi:tRNA-splicing ligase RtcB